MKNQKISKKVLSIALSALIGVSVMPLSNAYAMLTSSSSSSSSSSTVEDLLNSLPQDWKLGDEGHEQTEAQLLDLLCQNWTDFWKAMPSLTVAHNDVVNAAYYATMKAAGVVTWITAWHAKDIRAVASLAKNEGLEAYNAAKAADKAASPAVWQKNGAAYNVIFQNAKAGNVIKTKDGAEILIGSRKYFDNLIKVLDDQTGKLNEAAGNASASSSSSSSTT